jgi:hypothetical protein
MLGRSRSGVKHTAGRGTKNHLYKNCRHLSSLAVPHLEVSALLDIRMADLVKSSGDRVIADPA